MSAFLDSVKADLLDRRLLPLVALVVAALLGALAYVVLGGSSPAATPASVRAGAASPSAGMAISQKGSEDAVAETTAGASKQHRGAARNPFVPLPQPKAKTTTSSTSSGSGSSGSGSSGSGSQAGAGESGSGGSSTPGSGSPAPTPKRSKPKTVYHVAVLFGVIPAGATAQTAQLTPYENLRLLAPLPSAQQPLVVFRGVTAGGRSAAFTIVSEAILSGEGTCRPSPAQCQAIDLGQGKAEQLQYVSAEGQPVTYELKVVSIVSAKASSAAVKRMLAHASGAGRRLLHDAGLVAVPGLRYSSSQPGVLVFAGHRAFGARVHAK